ncbi:hypothetical protein TrLO_g6528 [Triparma laevis f. longispina]|uniref:EF-hand domain-containing protein n=1 Tax=Triparma laevis f. longispina TaxID=1714387 RepID=A0A9W7A396_9STRA|nr:hypothetical protein TrLO_g6528 [Triparma laevis f. longispina]
MPVKIDPTPPSEGTSDVANLDDLKAFEDDNTEVPQTPLVSKSLRPGPAAETRANNLKKMKKIMSPGLKKARRASKMRKLFRICVLLGYFALSLLYLQYLEYTSTTSTLANILSLTEPVLIQVRDCEVIFAHNDESELTVDLKMGAEEDAFYEIAGNNITVMPSPTSGLDCLLTVKVPEDIILPSLTLEGWRSVQTVNEVQCNFPFTVTGLDTNLTFYDCTYRVGSEEGGVGNGTLEDGYGPKSPWCAMVPTLSIDDMEAEDSDELLDFCEAQDQLPLISVSTNDDVSLDFGAYNSLTVFGSAMYVKLGGVSAANVDIEISEGMIQMEHLNVLYDSSFTTLDGDVTLVTTGVPAAFVNYTVGLADYCISARNMTILASSKANTTDPAAEDGRRRWLNEVEEEEIPEDTTTNSTEEDSSPDPFAPAYQSTGSVKICYDDTFCNDYANPTFKVNAPWGALYVTQAISIPQIDKAKNYNLAKGKSMNTPHFNGEGTFYLKGLRTWLEEDPDSDGFVTINSYGPGQDVGKWLFSTNIAYHFFDPWMLDVVSGGLLVPVRTDVRVRNIPSQCPYRSGWSNDMSRSIFDLGGASDALHRTIDTITSDSVVLNAIDTGDGLKTKFTYVSPTNVKKNFMKLTDSMASVLALLMSLILSFILGYVALEIFITKGRQAQKGFMVFLEAMGRYKRAVVLRETGQLSTFNIKIDNLKAAYEKSVKAKVGGDLDEDQEEEESALAQALNFKQRIIDWFMPNPKATPIATPYEVIENLAEGRARLKVKSLDLFLKKVSVPRPPSAPRMTPIDIKEFIEKYEYFCFHNKYSVYDVPSSDKILGKFGFAQEATSGTHTDVFTRLRFKTPRENEADRQNSNVSILPRIGENSLQAFIRVRCIVSGLDNDFITTRMFNMKYDNYVRASAIDTPIPITKRAMLTACNCPFERMTLTRIVSDDNASIIDFSLIKGPPSDKIPEMTVHDILEPGWWQSDIIAVFGHAIVPVVVMVPLLYATFKCEAAKASSSNREWTGLYDLQHAPWRFLNKDRYDLEPANFAFVIFGMVISGLCLLELFCHYAQMDFRPQLRNRPNNSFSYMRGYKWKPIEFWLQGRSLASKLFRYFLQRSIVNLVKFFVFLHFAYVALMFTWGILGAVLNPNKFLCYAAAAGTVLAFVGTQYKTLQKVMAVAKGSTGEGINSQLENSIKSSLAGCTVGKFAVVLSGLSGNEVKTAQAAREAVEDQADGLLAEHGFSVDIDLDDIFGEEIGESVKSELSLSRPWAATVLAIAERNDEKKKAFAAELTEIQGVEFDARVSEALIEIAHNDEDIRKAAAKRIFVCVWEALQERSPDVGLMPNPDLMLAILELLRGEALRFAELFEVDDPSLPAFQILIANQTGDESTKLHAIVKILDYYQRGLSQDADIDEALEAMIHLVEGKELMVQDWQEDSMFIRDYEILATLLGMPSVGAQNIDRPMPKHWGDGCSVTKNLNRSFLLRYMAVLVQQRASLLLHTSDEMGNFLNHQVFSNSNGLGKIAVHHVRALKAICVGTDINTTAFAIECGIDVSLANSVAYLLSEDQKRDQSTSQVKRKKASMMGLLQAMSPSSQVGWMAERARSNRTPKLMFGVISIAMRKTEGLEVDESIETMIGDYCVLHFGGEEPRASLYSKKTTIQNLIKFFTANTSAKMKRAALDLLDPNTKKPLIAPEMVELAALGAGFEEEINMERVADSVTGIFAGSPCPSGALEGKKWLKKMVEQAKIPEDEQPFDPELDANISDTSSTASSSIASSTNTNVLGRNILAGGESSISSKIYVANRLAEFIERKDAVVIGNSRTSKMGIADSLKKKEQKKKEIIEFASGMLEIKNKMPVALVELILRKSLPRMNITEALMKSVMHILTLPWCSTMKESAWKDVVTEVSELLNMDAEVLKASLGAMLPSNETDIDGDEGPATAEDDIASFLSESGASNKQISGSILFCSKWEVARKESLSALSNLADFSAEMKIPAFWPLMLATNNAPVAGNSIMGHLKAFLVNDLKIDPNVVSIMEAFTARDHHAVAKLKSDYGWNGIEKGIKLFGASDDMLTTIKLGAMELSHDPENYKDSASIAALIAFASRFDKRFDFVHRGEEGDDGRQNWQCHFPAKGEVQLGDSTITPSQILANQCCIPQGYIEALMAIGPMGVKREDLRTAIVSMVGEQGLEGNKERYIQPTGLNIEEVYARGFLSIASGATGSVEDIAGACGFDIDLAEGLVRITGCRAVDSDMCNYKTLCTDPGFEAMTKWMGLDRDISAAIVALVKQDKDNLSETSKVLGLGMSTNVLKALAVVSEVSTMNLSKDYVNGYGMIKACIAPLAKIYGVNHRKAAIVSAFVIRVAQGDLSPIMELAPTLGIGRTSIPFVAAISMLASPLPMVTEEGFESDWLQQRHSCTAARLLSKDLRCDESWLGFLLDAGRGLSRGIEPISILFSAALGAELDIEGTFIMVIYLIKHYPKYKKKSKFKWKEARREAECLGSLREEAIVQADLLSVLAERVGCEREVAHFFMAISFSGHALKTLPNVIDRYYTYNVTANPKEIVSKNLHVLVSIAHGDEENLRMWGRDCSLLKKLGFDVSPSSIRAKSPKRKKRKGRSKSPNRASMAGPPSVLSPVEKSGRSSPGNQSDASSVNSPEPGTVTFDGNLPTKPTENPLPKDSPIIFFVRLGHKNANAFDIKAEGNEEDDPTIAEVSINDKLMIPKAVFCLLNHNWNTLTKKPKLPQRSLITEFMLHLCTDDGMGRALVALATRGISCKENLSVMNSVRADTASKYFEHARPFYGVRPRELMEHIVKVTKRIGGTGGVYARCFMAGASEAPFFIEEAVSAACNKLGVGDIDIVVCMMKAQKGDLESLSSLALKCCAITDNVLGMQNVQKSCINALKYISNTSRSGWSEGFRNIAVLQSELFGSGEEFTQKWATQSLALATDESSFVRPEMVKEFEYSVSSRIDDRVFQIMGVLHVARNVLTQVKNVLTKITASFNLSEFDIKTLENMISLWNKSSAVFTNATDGNSIIKGIDDAWVEKFNTPPGAISLFFAANNSILDTIASSLKLLGSQDNLGMTFDSDLPHFLLALKRDSILSLGEKKEGHNVGPTVTVKEPMRNILWNMMVTLNGGEENLDDEWKHFSDEERRQKMRLFMSMFTSSQEFFQPLLLEMYTDLTESFLKQYELMVTPNSVLSSEDVEELTSRVMSNADAGTKEWITLMITKGSPSPVGRMLALIGNSVEEVWSSYPLYIMKESGLTPGQASILDILFKTGSTSTDGSGDDDKKLRNIVSECLKITRPDMKSGEMEDAIGVMTSYVSFANSILQDVESGSAEGWLRNKDQIIQGCSVDFSRGFIGIAMNDLMAFSRMAKMFQECEPERVCDFERVMIRLFPMKGLLDTGGGEDGGEDGEGGGDGGGGDEEEVPFSLSDAFSLMDNVGDGAGMLVFDEVMELLKLYKLDDVSEQRALWFFAKVDKDNSKTLDEEQFVEFMGYLQEESKKKVLEDIGYDTPTLAGNLALNVVILLLLFAFIFFGITGFAVAGSFGACINSALPVATGGGMGGDEIKEKLEELKDKIMKKIKSKMTGGGDEEEGQAGDEGGDEGGDEKE